MLNPEKNWEINKLNVSQAAEKIIGETEGDKHKSLKDFLSADRYKDSIYDNEEEIAKDDEHVKDLEKTWEDEKREMSKEEKERYESIFKRSEALERTFVNLFPEWFSSEDGDINVLTFVTTKYDDVVNGVDFVVEFELPETTEKVAMVVDASLGMDGMKNKLKSCHDKIKGKEGKVEVKYYESQVPDEEGNYPIGPLKNIVPLVVGMGAKNINNLFEDFADYLALREKNIDLANEKMDKIAEDSIKKVILNQIELQLDFYLSEKEKIDPQMLDKVNKIGIILNNISKNMKDVVPDFGKMDDPALAEIEKFTQKRERR